MCKQWQFELKRVNKLGNAFKNNHEYDSSMTRTGAIKPA